MEIPSSLAEQELANDFTLHIGFVEDGNWIGLYDWSRPVKDFVPTPIESHLSYRCAPTQGSLRIQTFVRNLFTGAKVLIA